LVNLKLPFAGRSLTATSLAACLVGWRTWRVLLFAAMDELLTEDERALFTQLTGRSQVPLQRVEEFVGVIGRRGGKSRAIATLAVYIAALCSHTDTLVPGETGLVLIIAPDQRQALIVLEYIAAALAATPILAQLVASRTVDTLTLTTGISIEVRSASFRRLRGPTYLAVIADEAAFLLADESANPDVEILNAVRPGLATTNGPLIIISSPYARRGAVWDTWRRHYGVAGDPLILVAQRASRTSTLPQSVVDRALERDERDAASASAEYLAQFRTDVESFVVQASGGNFVGVVNVVPVPADRYLTAEDAAKTMVSKSSPTALLWSALDEYSAL
jgi:hypothetical protein